MSTSMNNHISIITPVIEEFRTSKATRRRRRSILKEFALNTSTHGLPGAARSQSKHNFIFWIISFLIFTGIMIFFITYSIMNYFEYPTQTSISIVVKQSQKFPAVTVCNYAPGRYDHIFEPFLIYANLTHLTNENDTHVFTIEETILLREFLLHRLNAGDPVDNYFFTLDIMLISCSYNGEICTAADFISFLSPSYGICYTFNAKTKKENGSDVRLTNDNGGWGKLELRLYAQSHLYVPFVFQDVSAGMVAMIHDNTQLPRIDVDGIQLAPGRKHKLGYKKKSTYFLPSPYTECTNTIPPVMQAMFHQYEGAEYVYSQSVCITLCSQAYTYQECGCVNPFEWSARSVFLPDTNTFIEAPLCSSTDICYSNAAIRLSNTTSIWDEFCSDCTQECSTVDFIVTPSSVSAPSLPFAYVTKGFVESVSVPLPTNWTTDWLSEVQNNYVALEVVCESTQVVNYTQEASVSSVDVLSNVGGHTGLWIGLSFLSMMEFIEMLYRIFRYEFHTIKQVIQNKIRRRQ